MKKEMRICDICHNRINDSDKFSKIKRWKKPVSLDICYDCSPFCELLIKKLSLTYDDIEHENKRVIHNIVIGE